MALLPLAGDHGANHNLVTRFRHSKSTLLSLITKRSQQIDKASVQPEPRTAKLS